VDFEALRGVLLEKIFQVSGVEQQLEDTADEPQPEEGLKLFESEPLGVSIPGAYDLVVIGASTGGPPTVQTILELLGDTISVPVVIVQHMPIGFTQAFSERLNAYLPFRVREVVLPERLLPDTVYIAAAGQHMRVIRQDAELRAEISGEPHDVAHVPSIDVLFESAARAVGKRSIGVLLTGMGSDGAQGMLSLKKKGAYTMAQDEESCIVYGMPRSALALNAVNEMGSPETIGTRLSELIAAPED
jgi:two-component system chemotaxis response regulator CheB